MINVSLIHKELAEMTGRKARLGSPEEAPTCPECGAEMELISETEISPLETDKLWRCPICGEEITERVSITVPPPDEDPRLEDLLRQIAEHEARLAELKRLIAELEAKVGWTAEEEAERARLQSLIDEEEADAARWQAKINELERQVPFWKTRWDTARDFAKRLDPDTIAWPNWPVYYNISGAGLSYLNAWADDAVEGLADYRGRLERFAREPIGEKEVREEIIYMEEERFHEIVTHTEENPDLTGGLSIFTLRWKLAVVWPSKHNFRIHNWHPTFRAFVEDLVARAEGGLFDYDRSRWGIKYIAWATPSVADSWRPEVAGQIELAERTHYNLYTQLRDARDNLERANRRLWDAIAAKERYELAITRAIALRQAEVDAAKARYELELRTLDNLKATYEVLLKEIEAARTQAIAEAARQREEVIKAKEKDRLSIAEEQRRIAEEAERLAAESVGVEREEYLEKMRRALEIAKEAEEAAIAAALEREALAVDIALRKAELARIELELEELRKQQEITEERKEEAEKEMVRVYGLPGWLWPVLGIVGAGAGAVGIGYALKKKKKK